jgi:hypothetical protein
VVLAMNFGQSDFDIVNTSRKVVIEQVSTSNRADFDFQMAANFSRVADLTCSYPNDGITAKLSASRGE